MKAFFSNKTTAYGVLVTAREVETFASRWPCSGLLDDRGYGSPISFHFDSRGDLVDIVGEPEGADGSAMHALSRDAQTYAENHRRFKDRHVKRSEVHS